MSATVCRRSSTKILVIMQCDDSGGNSFIAAFDKKTGKEAWRVPRKVDVTWSTPVLVNTGDAHGTRCERG